MAAFRTCLLAPLLSLGGCCLSVINGTTENHGITDGTATNGGTAGSGSVAGSSTGSAAATSNGTGSGRVRPATPPRAWARREARARALARLQAQPSGGTICVPRSVSDGRLHPRHRQHRRLRGTLSVLYGDEDGGFRACSRNCPTRERARMAARHPRPGGPPERPRGWRFLWRGHHGSLRRREQGA